MRKKPYEMVTVCWELEDREVMSKVYYTRILNKGFDLQSMHYPILPKYFLFGLAYNQLITLDVNLRKYNFWGFYLYICW